MSILPSCAINFATRASQTSGSQKRSAAPTPFPSSPRANWISRNVRSWQERTERMIVRLGQETLTRNETDHLLYHLFRSTQRQPFALQHSSKHGTRRPAG